MPTVIGQIGGIHLYAWVFSAYLLSSTVSMTIYGKLADLFGRKPVLLTGTALFLVGSMLCGQSQTMEQLIAFRFLQGLGAGGMLPITQTVLGDIYPLEQRARITGLFSTVWGVSGLLGPGVGGFLTEHVRWAWGRCRRRSPCCWSGCRRRATRCCRWSCTASRSRWCLSSCGRSAARPS